MRRFSLLAVLLAFIATTASADRYIVTKQGDGIWATRANRDGSNIVYSDRNTGEERTIAEGELIAVIPTVRKGKDYTSEDVNKYIDRIQKAKRQHPRLKRSLNALLSDWKALLKPVEDLSGDIEALIKRFMEGERSVGDYKKTSMELGMLSYKDKRGRFNAQNERAQAEVKDACILAGRERLAALAASDPVALDAHAEMEILHKGLRKIAGETDLSDLEAMMEKARLSALHSSFAKCKRALTRKAATLDRYLVAIGTLRRLERDVARGDGEMNTLSKLKNELGRKMAGAFPDYKFNRQGFPFHAGDLTLRAKMRGAMPPIRFQSIELDEQCFLIPRRHAGAISKSGGGPVTLRALFNQVWHRCRYGLKVVVYGAGQTHEHVHVLPELKIQNGHADVDVVEDFGFLPDDFQPIGLAVGTPPAAYYFMVLQVPGADEDDWQAISLARGRRLAH